MQFRRFIIYILLMLAVASTAFAQSAKELAENLPHDYEGTFSWDDKKDIQEVHIHLHDIQAEEGMVVAYGKGVYIMGEDNKARIMVKLIIDPLSRAFAMYESDPGVQDFVSSGAHVGKISDNLQSISAVWTTQETHRTGRLELRAD